MAFLLETLSNAFGVSGNERVIRDIIIKEISPHVNKIEIDSMGSIIAVKHGRNSKKVMLASHMDEPGFIVSSITDNGYIRFKSVGKIDARTIVSKRVIIGKNNIRGVIGMKAIHLQKKQERENVAAVSDLFIDIGEKTKKAAEKKVSVGDFISFDTEFKEAGAKVKGKALSRAISSYCLAETLKQDFECDIYAVFAAQNEIDARGAHVAAYAVQPETAVVIGTVESADMFGVKPQEKSAVLGGGAVIGCMDKLAIFAGADETAYLAEKNGIPIQLGVSADNLSAGGAVQTAADGARVINIAVPCRYLHSPVSMASKSDIDAALSLISAVLKNI